MKINGQASTSIWYNQSKECVTIIDQTLLPHTVKYQNLCKVKDFITAIKTMQVRGAPLIGVTGAFALAFALKDKSKLTNEYITKVAQEIANARPTAVNLQWAVGEILTAIDDATPDSQFDIAIATAEKIRADDIANCSQIGGFGLEIIKDIYDSLPHKRPVNILTHCNAGWLATIDWGTAIAPIYKAQEAEIPIHVWVDETRPRNQGASLTAFELSHQEIPHTIIPDNTGGHLMQHGLVDLCIVGSDRTTSNGDVCNKIGTYLKALAAYDNSVPFYVALPCSTFDWNLNDGLAQIPIEQRDPTEVSHMTGVTINNAIETVRIIPEGCKAANYGFDVTPAKYITGLITEKGVFEASQTSLAALKAKLEA